MTQRFDVCIRGGGIVGSTLALLLAQQRLRVALVARPPHATPGPDGHGDMRAYALNAASRQCLDAVRGWPETEGVVTPVTRMDVCGDHGGQLSFAATDVQQPNLNWIVDVPALEARLADALRFQSGVQRLDTPPAHAALTVVCEGRRSATRAEFGFDHQVKPYPHHALAARLRLAQPHGGVARQWFHRGETAALLPLGGEGGHGVALVWSVDTAKAQRLQSTEPADFVAELAAVCGLPASELALTHAPMAWPLELSEATHWTQAGVALAGDAAHAMHPLAGQGLNLGLADVAELARVLQTREYWRELGDPKLLRRYERARKADFAAMGGVTDGLFVLFNHGNGLTQKLRNWGLNGVNQLPPLKSWLTRRAMGVTHAP
jgi:2-polyprenyl-6-methoxyphenol hydroxylase-like FAD-dependent oxidoreductase